MGLFWFEEVWNFLGGDVGNGRTGVKIWRFCLFVRFGGKELYFMLCGCLNGKVGIGDGAAVGFAVLGASLHFHMLLYAVQVDIEGRDE